MQSKSDTFKYFLPEYVVCIQVFVWHMALTDSSPLFFLIGFSPHFYLFYFLNFNLLFLTELLQRAIGYVTANEHRRAYKLVDSTHGKVLDQRNQSILPKVKSSKAGGRDLKRREGK